MNKTAIEWVFNPDGSRLGMSWNPITGCLNGCPYCYARRLANTRLRGRYLRNKNTPEISWVDGVPIVVGDRYKTGLADPFYPRFWPEILEKLVRRNSYYRCGRKPRGLFVCDMGDLFGNGVPVEWTNRVMFAIRGNAIDRFYLLTKQPQNLAKFSPFPENCWVGVSATDTRMALDAGCKLGGIEATVKFLSLEPLLAPVNLPSQFLKDMGISWIICGQATPVKASTSPKVEWVEEIVKAADKAGIPVFLKNNLLPLFGELTIADKWAWAKDLGYGGLQRQEVPK